MVALRLLVLMLAFVAAACASSVQRVPPPIASLGADVPPPIAGIENARFWADTAPPNLAELLAEVSRQRAASGLVDHQVMISLSGGGDDGAFGAGLMRGWTETGDRPEFVTVTGVSTGALSAPFVFLGPKYDAELQQLYGGLSPDAYFTERPLVDILPGVSLYDSAPLYALIEKYANDQMLADIAAEHRRGRRLLIQSTHLDAQRAVIWDLGAIAASGAPGALEVFRKALLASAAIPVAFPPVLFDVTVDGQTYQELHVDGGVISEDTTLAEWAVDIAASRGRGRGLDTLYLLRNGRVGPSPTAVDYTMLGVAGRSVSTLIKSQGTSNIMAGFGSARLIGADFKVTWIGEDFDHPYPGPFDPGYMNALQEYGYRLMLSGHAWTDRPPMLMSTAERAASPRPVIKVPVAGGS